MVKKLFSEVDDLILNAEKQLNEVNDGFKSLLTAGSMKNPSQNIDSQVNALNLVLQYRMDSQNALIGLMRFERSVLQLLGVENLSSMTENIDRLAYALGFEDLQQCLSSLNRLIEMLLQMVYKQQQSQHSFEKHKQQLKEEKIKRNDLAEFKKINKHQKQFISDLEELNLHVEKIIHREAIGPVHNHIAGLQGPISRFYQFIQSGLKHSHQVMNKIEPNIQPNNSIQSVLKQTEKLIDNLSLQNQHNKLFEKKVDPAHRETLEQRAAKRRLGHFFGH